MIETTMPRPSAITSRPNYANRGRTYDEYEPAYRYGYTLANDRPLPRSRLECH